MQLISLILLAIIVLPVHAGQNLFIVKKNINPGNYFKVDAQVNSSCQLVPYANGKYIEGYWIMGEEQGQRQSMSILEERSFNKARVSYINSTRTEVDFIPANMELARKYFSNPVIHLRSRLKNGVCGLEAIMDINGQEIKLKQLDVNVSKFLSINYVTVKGTRPDGSAFQRTYHKK